MTDPMDQIAHICDDGQPDKLARIAAVLGMDKVEAQRDGALLDAFGLPRKQYTRVIVDGATCVCDDVQLAEWRDDEVLSPGTYRFEPVWLSEREFDDLPEFDGF